MGESAECMGLLQSPFCSASWKVSGTSSEHSLSVFQSELPFLKLCTGNNTLESIKYTEGHQEGKPSAHLSVMHSIDSCKKNCLIISFKITKQLSLFKSQASENKPESGCGGRLINVTMIYRCTRFLIKGILKKAPGGAEGNWKNKTEQLSVAHV